MPSSNRKTPPSELSERKIRIGMVLDQPFPPDARVEREATALVKAGYEIHLLCAFKPQDDDAPEEAEEMYKGIHIHRVNPNAVTFLMPVFKVKTRWPYRGWIKNLNRFLWNIDTSWHTLIRRFVYHYDIDILHIHDLRLVSTGLAVAEKYDLPVVADLHENYPALMEMLKGKSDPERGEKARQRWEEIEKYCTFEAERVITVIDEAKTRLVNKGIRPEKITVIPNTVDMAKFRAAQVNPKIIQRYRDDFVLTYVGFINSDHRGIHTVLEAMHLLKDKIPNLRFIAAGGYREPYREKLEALIKKYDLADQVDFTGWLDEIEFVSYIEAASICLCPHVATDHTNATFPNKVYLYNLFSKPVLASSCVPLERYIDDSGGGLCFESENAQALAHRIQELHDNTELRKTLGRRGRKAVVARYCWKHTSAQLIDMYADLIAAAFRSRVPAGI